MPTVLDIRDLQDLGAFAVWSLAVWGLAHVLFRSLLADAVKARLVSRRQHWLRERQTKLIRDLKLRRDWDPRIAELRKTNPLLHHRPLSEAELQERKLELGKVSAELKEFRLPGWHPVALGKFFLGCPFCHLGQSAVLLLIVSALSTQHAALSPFSFAVSVLAYAAAGRGLDRLLNPPGADADRAKPGCACGRH